MLNKLREWKKSLLKVIQGVEVNKKGDVTKEVRGVLTGIHINYLLIALIAATILF